MATQNNEEIVRKLYEAFANKRYDEAYSYFDENAEFTLLSEPDKPRRGVKEIRDAMDSWLKSFSDMSAEIVNVISAGDTVIAEVINRGTHDGPMPSRTGFVQPTHRKIEVPSADVYKIADGKIVSWRCYWQGDLMMEQLGLAQYGQAAA